MPPRDRDSDNGRAPDGFSRITGSITSSNYCIAENRQYLGFGETLRTGPYNFVTENYAERYPYQNGLPLSYRDAAFNDNNSGEYPGEGRILPVDSHPVPFSRSNGSPWRTRVRVYDATFGVEPTDGVTLTSFGQERTYPSQPAVSAFDDRNAYWYASKPGAGVKVPNTGTTVRVKGQSNGAPSCRSR